MDVLNGRSNPLVMRLSTSLVTLLATLAPARLCAQQLTVTLVAPEFNGHHVDCFGHRTGSIDAAVPVQVVQWCHHRGLGPSRGSRAPWM